MLENMVWAWQGTASSAEFTEQTGASHPFNGMLAMRACFKVCLIGRAAERGGYSCRVCFSMQILKICSPMYQTMHDLM